MHTYVFSFVTNCSQPVTFAWSVNYCSMLTQDAMAFDWNNNNPFNSPLSRWHRWASTRKNVTYTLSLCLLYSIFNI